MKSCSNISFAAFLCVVVVGCGKKDDGSKDKKIGQLEQKIQHAKEREGSLKGELAQLNQRITRLQNDFKIYSQKPCEFELDPIEYTLQKKGTTPSMTRPKGMGMKKPTRTGPAATPEVLKKWRTKARKSRRGYKRCYQNAMKKNASLQIGSRRVKVKFTVKPSGRMGRILVIPPVGSGFEGCLRGLLRKWRFNRFKGGARTFVFAMNLRPN